MSYYQFKSSRTSDRNRRPSYPRSNSRGPKKENIHPSRFIQSAKLETELEYKPTHNFSDFEVHSVIHDNLARKNFTAPTAIQDQTIPIGLAGKDIVGIANTGTGKTAAFAIPMLNKLMSDKNSAALIMAPTRELAQQIEEECRSIAKNSGIHGAILIGGVAMGPQLRDLRMNPQIVIGTPGRIKDHATQGSLNLGRFNIVVLDEVDRMLDMGFINDISHILKLTASNRQSFFFSATLDSRVKTIIEGFSSDPVHIIVKTGDTSNNVEQNIVTYMGKEEKIKKLHELLIQDGVTKTLVFDDTHRSVEKLSKELEMRGFITDAIHGGK